jgi:hypothetical protein
VRTPYTYPEDSAKSRYTPCDQIPSEQSSILSDQHLRRDYIHHHRFGHPQHPPHPTRATRFFGKNQVLAIQRAEAIQVPAGERI